ncbi:hypothetical protein NEISICOT_02633 [Neisseria sicca ATCC 29256]|uniref:Uncharacterized protein n=1 Tax=Neisseria sicca ATCC 29256 TaxID=547045 RepID=C6M7W8_NEISI|nr:hypothetical protein NEISICOT_02633 [Neisseria sicca ATCC 29256]
MLKLTDINGNLLWYGPAAFGRLCVETTDISWRIRTALNPAAFGRLCVETLVTSCPTAHLSTSRLRAAVC